MNSMSEMVSVCKALSVGKTPKGKRLGIFTHTAGPSIVAWDILGREPGCELAQLQKSTVERIAEILGPSVPVVHKNPVDGAAGAFLPEPYHKISEAVLKDPSVDAMLAIFCEHKNWIYPSDVLIEVASRSSKPVVACFIGSVKPISQIGTNCTRQAFPHMSFLKMLQSGCEHCSGESNRVFCALRPLSRFELKFKSSDGILPDF